MANLEPQLIVDYPSIVGEGPLWHEDEVKLYWVDITGGKLFRYDPATGKNETVFSDHVVGGYTIQADGSLLLFGERGAITQLRDGQLTPFIEDIPAERETRFNDVIADPAGRVFCGTMPTESRSGRLYRLDLDGTLTEVIDNVGVSNGMGFTADLTTMYHTDTTKGTITAFHYDQTSGEISDGQVIIQVGEREGHPDGMTIDSEDHIWSARWDGSALYRFAPDGEEVSRIPFPVRKVSSVTFGGPDYATAYVTTAGGNLRPDDGDLAGSLFQLDLGVTGRAPFRSRIGV